MKTHSYKLLLAAGAVLAVTACSYADFDNTFDSPAQASEASGNAVWSAGPAGWVGAGCLQDTDPNGGWGGGNPINLNFSFSSGDQPNIWAMDATQARVSFDILLDSTSFPANVDGFWQIFVAGNTHDGGFVQSQVLGANWDTNNTSLQVHHVDMAFSDLGFTPADATDSSYYILDVWANSDTPNPVNFYLDNLSFYTPATVQPSNSIAVVTGPKGLTMRTSTNVFSYDVGNEQFQRQNVRSATTGYNWLGSPDPVTYSLTITNFPDAAHSNFQTQVWLVDGPANANAPDYNNADVVSLSINNNSDGTANGNLAYKVNQPSGNSMYYASGNLGNVFSATPLGTWSITFTNDDFVTVTSPDGHTLSTNLTIGDSANFGDPLTIYIDSQSIVSNNIGQKAVFSKFQIVSNNVTLFSDDFSSGVLDPSKWISTQAEDPANVFQIPTTAAFKVSWTLPDGGFSLQASTNLSTPNWANPGLPTAIIDGQRTTFVPASNAATNPAQFFRLAN